MAMPTDIPNSTQPEETPKVAPKRSSSVGAAFKRLFSQSPSQAERASSVASPSLLAAEHPKELGLRGGTRGRTPPKHSASPPTPDSENPGETSSLPPNNSFYFCPTKSENDASIKNMGGREARTQSLLFAHDRITRAAMAQTAAMAQSHRGIVEGGSAAIGGT